MTVAPVVTPISLASMADSKNISEETFNFVETPQARQQEVTHDSGVRTTSVRVVVPVRRSSLD